VAGNTESANYPTTTGAYDATGNGDDAFVSQIETVAYTASVTTVGPGCPGSATGVSLLAATSAPVLGQSMQLTVTNAPPLTQGALFFSASLANLNLAPFGAVGCTLYASPHITVSFVTDALGSWFNPPAITIPNSLPLIGAQFWNQAVLVDIGSPPLYVIVSNGTEATIGF